MSNNINPPSKLYLEMYNHKVSAEWATSDVGADEILFAFYGILVSQGFPESIIISTFREFIDLKTENEKDQNQETI